MVAIVTWMKGFFSWGSRRFAVCALTALCLLPLNALAQSNSKPFYETMRHPPAAPTFVEASGGLLFPMTSLDNPGQRLLNVKTDWSMRLPINVAAGWRVWKPLNLDVGLRLGMSFQTLYNENSISHHYDPSIRMVEVVPFGRATFFPFKTNEWGLMTELGMGFLIPYGGAFGPTELPEAAQLALRFRLGTGVLWRFDENNAAVFHLHSLFDIAATAEWQSKIGHQVSLELTGGYQLRF